MQFHRLPIVSKDDRCTLTAVWRNDRDVVPLLEMGRQLKTAGLRKYVEDGRESVIDNVVHDMF